MENSSDLRSIKTDLIIKLLKYNPEIWIHKMLSIVSKKLHLKKRHIDIYNNFLNYLISRYVREYISNNKKTEFDIKLEKNFNKLNHKDEISILTKYKF